MGCQEKEGCRRGRRCEKAVAHREVAKSGEELRSSVDPARPELTKIGFRYGIGFARTRTGMAGSQRTNKRFIRWRAAIMTNIAERCIGKASHAVEMTRPRSVQLVDALVCNAS